MLSPSPLSLPRNRTAALALAAVALAASGPLTAQKGASTLAALLERADVVVQARTSGIPSGNAAVHRYRFQTEMVLHGSAPAEFELGEPAGDSCGRALAGLAPGSYLLFMVEESGGRKLAVSGARSVVAAELAVVVHVRALISAPSGRDRLGVLGAALASTSPRVVDDAATTLAHLPNLPGASVVDRSRIAAALRRALDREASADSLLVAAERLRLIEAVDELVDAYLEGRHPRLEPLLLRAIPRIGGEQAARRAAVALPSDAAGRRRAAVLLAELPPAAARQPLVELLTGASDAAAVRAGAALLAAGADPHWIERLAAPSVLEAIRRTAHRPVFRSILRGSAP